MLSEFQYGIYCKKLSYLYFKQYIHEYIV